MGFPDLHSINRVSLQINESCDSRCKLCDYWTLKNPKTLSKKTFDEVVVPHLRSLGTLQNICITGGEPTLHADLSHFARTAASLSDTVTLITSTSNLDSVFNSISPHLTNIMISLDGYEALSYKQTRGVDLFSHATSWIRRIKDTTNIQIAVSSVIQTGNFNLLEQIVDVALASGAHNVFLRVPSMTPEAFGRQAGPSPRTNNSASLTNEQIDSVRSQLTTLASRFTREQLPNMLDYSKFVKNLRGEKPGHGTTCDVPFTSMVIDPDGNYMPCFYMPFSVSIAKQKLFTQMQASIKTQLLSSSTFRDTHCDGCQQYVDRRWRSAELETEFDRQALVAASHEIHGG